MPLGNLLEQYEKDYQRLSQDNSNQAKTYLMSKPRSEKIFTAQQEEILNAKEDVFKVIAYAGSGKTFLLEHFAKRNLFKKQNGNPSALYLAFNRDLKLEAEKRFPDSVRCVTMHGLAFPKFGAPLVHKLNTPFYASHISQLSGLKLPSAKTLSFVGKLYFEMIYNAVMNFTYSSSRSISKYHFDFSELKVLIDGLEEANNRTAINLIKSIKIEDMIDNANLVWSHMIDPLSPLGTTHDCYLKLMQLSGMRVPYNTLLLDEAQDVNPAMLSFFEYQKTRKMITGDPYQSIYKFRGAVDAMEETKADAVYRLTQSFRFGQNVADVANTILALRGETHPVVGFGQLETQVALLEDYEHKLPELFQQYPTKAVITRTNAKMFEVAVEYAQQGYDIYVEGGEKVVRLDLLKALYDLAFTNKKVYTTDPFLSQFIEGLSQSGQDNGDIFDTLKEFAKTNELTEWGLRCKLVEKYAHDLPYTISSLEQRLSADKDSSKVIITNVHKSKGLEYDLVILADDFNLSFLLSETKKDKELKLVVPIQYEDVNLLYVAATRAKKMLLINNELLYHANNLHRYRTQQLIYRPNNMTVGIYNQLEKRMTPDIKNTLEAMKKHA